MSVTHNIDAVVKSVKDLPKQVKFATVIALNKTAVDVQKFTIQSLLPEKFTLRSRGKPWFTPGTRYGFNIRFASKDRPQSEIGSRADWLDLQERGGEKKVAGHRLAIPSSEHKPKAEMMTRARKPRTILRKGTGSGPLPFTATMPSGHQGIFQREGPERLPIKELFNFQASATIKPRLQFEKRGKEVVEKVYQGNFQQALVKAIATAK